MFDTEDIPRLQLISRMCDPAPWSAPAGDLTRNPYNRDLMEMAPDLIHWVHCELELRDTEREEAEKWKTARKEAQTHLAALEKNLKALELEISNCVGILMDHPEDTKSALSATLDKTFPTLANELASAAYAVKEKLDE